MESLDLHLHLQSCTPKRMQQGAEAVEQPLPGLRTLTYRRLVQGTPTDVHFTSYADRVLLVITQLGSAGTVIEASVDTVAGAAALQQQEAGGGAPTYTTTVLLGRRDEPLLQLCARQIVHQAEQSGCTKPILLCLGLGREASGSVAAVKEVVRLVAQCNVWGGGGSTVGGAAAAPGAGLPAAEGLAQAAGGFGGDLDDDDLGDEEG